MNTNEYKYTIRTNDKMISIVHSVQGILLKYTSRSTTANLRFSTADFFQNPAMAESISKDSGSDQEGRSSPSTSLVVNLRTKTQVSVFLL